MVDDNYLAAFKAPTTKMIKLWSCTPCDELHRPRALTGNTLTTRSADGSATGKQADLKRNQAYPRLFGRAVAKLCKKLLLEQDPDDMFEDDVADFLVDSCIADAGSSSSELENHIKPAGEPISSDEVLNRAAQC